VIEERIKGKRTQGKRRIDMIDELMESTYGEMKRKAELTGELGHHGTA